MYLFGNFIKSVKINIIFANLFHEYIKSCYAICSIQCNSLNIQFLASLLILEKNAKDKNYMEFKTSLYINVISVMI